MKIGEFCKLHTIQTTRNIHVCSFRMYFAKSPNFHSIFNFVLNLEYIYNILTNQ